MRLSIKTIIVMLILAGVIVPQSASGFTSWKTLVTDSFIIYYPKGYELQAYNALQTLEYHRPYVEELTGHSRKRFPIVIEDIGNIANGFANPVADRIVLFNHLPTNSEIDYVEDWWTMLGVHEYIHILQMTNEGGIPQSLRKLFGNFMYTNLLQTSFMLEGITVFGESDIHPYSGRMNGGYYPAVISTLAKTDKLPDRTKANYFSADTPLGNFYVYGGSFYSYLSEQYGRNKFADLYNYRGRSLRSWLAPIFPNIGVDNAFRKVYGKNINKLWKEWQNYEKSKDFSLPDNYLTNDGGHKYSLTIKGNNLYYLSRDVTKTGAGRSFAHHSLKSFNINTGTITERHRQASPYPAGYHLTFDDNDRPSYLYYTRNEYRRGFANTYLSGIGSVPELYRINLLNSTKERLFRGSFRAFTVLDDGIVIISKDLDNNMGSEIYRIDRNGKELLMESDYLIHNFYPHNGKIYVDARSFWRNSSIFELDLASNKLIPIVDNPVSENISGFHNDMIIYTANYDDYLSAYLICPVTKESSKLAGSSFMKSANISDDMTYYLSLSPKGYEIAAVKLFLQDFDVPFFPENYAPFSQITNISDSSSGKRMTLNMPPAYSRLYDKNIDVKESGYWRNMAHLLVPRQVRFPSVVYGTQDSFISYEIGGNDAVGHFPYWWAILKYDLNESELEYELLLNNRLLSPLKHDFYYSNIDNKTIGSNQYIDIIERMNWGVNNVRAGINYQTKEDFERKIVNPYIDLGLNGFNRQMWNRVSFLTEREEIIASDRDRNGFRMYNNLRQKLLLDSEVVFRLYSAYDPDAESNEVFGAIRGYKEGLAARQGILLQSSLNKVLFEVRKGIWSPQIYLEDIGFTLFFDTAVPRVGEGAEMQYSFGAELLAETHIGFFVPAYLGYRIAYNREKTLSYEVMLHASFLFDSFWKY